MAWTRAKAAADTVVASTAIAGIVIAGAVVAGAVACSSGPSPPTGTVQGLFEKYAGPTPVKGPLPSGVPVSGEATFTDASGHAVTVAVPDTGKFTVRLATGTYTVLMAPTNLSTAEQTVHVRADRTVTITLDCSWDSGAC